jgi:hypothetical protein
MFAAVEPALGQNPEVGVQPDDLRPGIPIHENGCGKIEIMLGESFAEMRAA